MKQLALLLASLLLAFPALGQASRGVLRVHGRADVLLGEGALIGLDNMVIDKSAPRPDLALKFMNFMLEGQNAAELTNLVGSGNPNAAAVEFIKPEVLKHPAIFPDKAAQAKPQQVPDLTGAQRRLLNKLWTEIKAGR